MRKLLKLIGVGLLSGAACRFGSMLADALFPRGLGEYVSRFNKPRDEDKESTKKKRYLQVWQRD